MNRSEIVNGLKTVPGFGLLLAINELENELSRIQNDIAYSFRVKTLNEYKDCYNKYWKK